ncbi:phage portal protein [Candidatus Anaplasma sp. TIGMIC]|uniref:phage portal protein n=1 Tax=Candidatus Anaplasma sp. TIGMIC TaxID=3020713 RepID=UPI00232B0C69|nr:phage portal protein [Candidatus Anaplasma sp. TIGMIC]MDB1135486.1 phage portal protein [Candidatus Anaplasma sp. TIGMIC]
MKESFGIFSRGNGVSSFLDCQREAIWEERDYFNFARNGYIKNVIAFRSIHMIASSAGSVSLTLNRITKKGVFPVGNHPLLQLLARPNNAMTRAEFIEGIITYRLISGNSYVLSVDSGATQPKELHLLRPDRVEIVTKGCAVIYRYMVNGAVHEFTSNNSSHKHSLLHLKNFHPLNDWYGLSTIEAASYSIDQHNQAGSWNQAMLQNGARPSGALIVNNKDGRSSSLSQDQYQRLKSQIENFYSGHSNSGRPILLEGGLEWKEMSLTPKDMDFIESKNISAREIALAFGVPPQLIGIPGDNTYSNLSEARLALWEQTVIPHLESIIAHFNSWLVPRFGHNLFLSYDKESISVLTEKRQRLWQYVQNASFMTINEKRAAFGLHPIEGGNTIHE